MTGEEGVETEDWKVHTEWGVQYGGHMQEIEPRNDERDARVVARMYREDGASVICREVHTGPWTKA